MPSRRSRFHRFTKALAAGFFGMVPPAMATSAQPDASHSPIAAATNRGEPEVPPADRENGASIALQTTMLRLAHGPSFDAKLRQTVWSEDRQILGVGTCTHAGRGTGRYRIQITMHDGRDKHSMMQISDGRLAWTSLTVGGNQRISRVDLGRVEKGDPSLLAILDSPDQRPPKPLSGATAADAPRLPQAMRVGGLIEMLDQIIGNYRLHLRKARLHDVPVWVISGQMDARHRTELASTLGVGELSRHHPGHARVVIADRDDPQTGFGRGLPIRFEYWNQPPKTTEPSSVSTGPQEASAAASVTPPRRMVSVIELHAVRPIKTPDAVDFRYEWSENDVDFVNETSRYQRSGGPDTSVRSAANATQDDPKRTR